MSTGEEPKKVWLRNIRTIRSKHKGKNEYKGKNEIDLKRQASPEGQTANWRDRWRRHFAETETRKWCKQCRNPKTPSDHFRLLSLSLSRFEHLVQLQICANRTEVYFILSKVDSPSKLTARDSAREPAKEKQQPCTRETTMTSPPRCSALKQTTGFGKSERHLLAGNGQTREPFGPCRTRTSRHPKAVAPQLRSLGLGVFSYN